MGIYLDNAASTPIHPDVLDEMLPYFKQFYGNPSSIHAFGKKNRAAVEQVRKNIGTLLNTPSKNIVFCSSGSEANNMIITNAVYTLGVKHLITSAIEHKCVLNTAKHFESLNEVEVHLVKLKDTGMVDLVSLKEIIQSIKEPFLVSLMHVQNEIGAVNPISEIAQLVKEFNGYFHTDTVQSIGKYKIDLNETPIDFLSGSAHKFYGPLGIGFLIRNDKLPFSPWIYGGGQEKNIRSGTENYPAIVGMGKAINLAFQNLEQNRIYVATLKSKLMNGLQQVFDNALTFNGGEESSPWILSVNFPASIASDTIMIMLDLEGVAISGGSACSSGALKKSDVLEALGVEHNLLTIRFSFSIFNTMQEIEQTITIFEKLKKQA